MVFFLFIQFFGPIFFLVQFFFLETNFFQPSPLSLIIGDLPTRLINVVWDVIKKNDIETARQVNTKYRDREMGATYASVYASTKTSSSKLLQLTQTTRAAKDSSTDIYENVPYVKILNLGIHWSCSRGHLEMLDYLLDEAGANSK